MIFNGGSIGYGLHDSQIDDVKLSHSGVIFTFNSGVYLLDETGKETFKSKPCDMVVDIQDFEANNEYEHITILKIYKNKIAELEYKRFLQILKESNFRISIDYYSAFAKSILFEGYVKKYKIKFIITEIKTVTFSFMD